MQPKTLKLFLTTLFFGSICCNLVPLDDTWESSLAYWFDYNKYLLGHVIESLNVFLAECIEACQKNLICFSINYSEFPNGSYLCELNRSTKKQSMDSYKNKTGYRYGEPPIKKYCENGHCYKKEALPDGWYELDGQNQYKLINMTKTWTDARTHCQNLGGDLLSFSGHTSQMALKFVTRLFDWISPLELLRLDGNDKPENISLRNGARFSQLNGRNALQLDGNDNYAEIKLDLKTTDFTYAFWYYLISPVERKNVVFSDSSDPLQSPWFSITIDAYHDAIYSLLRNRGGQKITGHGLKTAALNNPLNRWVHMANTWDRKSLKSNLYIDGELKSTSSPDDGVLDVDVTPLQANKAYYLGGNLNGVRFKGWLSDFAAFQTVLDDSMVKKLKYGLLYIDGVWTGLNDKETEGVLKWSDGKPLSYVPSPVSTNTDQYNCFMLMKRPQDTVQWIGEKCSKKKKFICQKS